MGGRVGWSLLISLAMFLVASSPVRSAEDKLTNDDIVRMQKAGVSESIIIQTIRSSKQNFDLTPTGIIALKEQKVPDSIIEAMQNASAPQAPAASPAATATSSMGMGVTLVDGGDRIQMRYSAPQARGGAFSTKAKLLSYA